MQSTYTSPFIHLPSPNTFKFLSVPLKKVHVKGEVEWFGFSEKGVVGGPELDPWHHMFPPFLSNTGVESAPLVPSSIIEHHWPVAVCQASSAVAPYSTASCRKEEALKTE